MTGTDRSKLAAYTAAIFLSALLLFSVQPMIAKMVLPVLGGAPATWAVSLCFFQAVLLAGYAYAHVVGTRLSSRSALAVHAALLLLALLTLPVRLPASFPTPPSGAYVWLLALLAVTVGLPFFALSANAPLIQAWFARLGHVRSANPYVLYAASNAGSLAALVAYPLIVEPLLPLTVQAWAWTAGFAALVLLIAACGTLVAASSRPRPALHLPLLPSAGPEVPPSTLWRERLIWIALAFVPSGLLVAYTTFLTTDLASAPLLWVVPLALFLLTFVLVFRDPPLSGLRVVAALQPAAVAAVLAANESTGSLSWAAAALAGLVAFVLTGLACHGELYGRRPGPQRLTEFYLLMSLGGALGGIFAALIAPLLFTNILELPLLLAAGMACRPALWRAAGARRDRIELVALLLAAAAGVLAIERMLAAGLVPQALSLRPYIIGGLGVAVIAAYRWPRIELALVTTLLLAVALLPQIGAPVHVTRSFFGTHRVVDSAGGTFRMLLHGTTIHGIQRNGERGRPTSLGYYHASGPIAQGLKLARAAATPMHRPFRVGIIGLGTGALACYAEPGDHWRFFEIDPSVVAIATNPAYFRYLSACTPDPVIAIGDARLTLADEPVASFDALVIDAFSSDAIPIHLLTVEALRLYASRLAPRGILILHISNQNLDLPPVVEANLAAIPELKGVYAEGERGAVALPSQAVLVSSAEDVLAPALRLPKARPLGPAIVRPWTDDYSDILSAIVRRYRAKLGLAASG